LSRWCRSITKITSAPEMTSWPELTNGPFL
jgi:hypothetical protein